MVIKPDREVSRSPRYGVVLAVLHGEPCWRAVRLLTKMVVRGARGASRQVTVWSSRLVICAGKLRTQHKHEIRDEIAKALNVVLAQKGDTLPALQNAQFQGRDVEMKKLEEWLPKGRTAAACIWAMSGMGKSQLALEYALRHKLEYSWLLWVSGGEKATLRGQYAGLASVLGVQVAEGTEDKEAKMIEAIRERLKREERPVLLILDDVEHPDDLNGLLPTGGPCHTLITTRRGGGVPELRNMKLEGLTATEALALASGKRYFETDELDALKKVCDLLGNLTLALAIVSGIVLMEWPSDLLKRLQRQDSFGPEARDPGFQRDNPNLGKLFTASFVALERPSDRYGDDVRDVAMEVALLGGWFAPIPIPEGVLLSAMRQLRQADVDETVLSDASNLLAQHGLATRSMDRGEKGLSFHALVQWYERLQDGAQQAGLAVVRSLCAQKVGTYDDSNTEHLSAVFGWVLPKNKIAMDTEGLKDAVESLGIPLANRLTYRSRYTEAQGVLDSTRDTASNTGFWKDAMGDLLKAQGHYADAEPLYRASMEIRREALGDKHPDYAASLNNLAGLLEAQGHYADAEPLYRASMEIWREALGEKHPDYAASLNNLAGLLQAMGHYADAEPLYRASMEILKEALGEKHPDYAASLNNLAVLLELMGRHADAERIRAGAVPAISRGSTPAPASSPSEGLRRCALQ